MKVTSSKISTCKDEYEKARMDMKQLEEQLKAKKTGAGPGHQDFVIKNNCTSRTTIKEFLKDYNKDKTYSYIFAYEQGFVLLQGYSLQYYAM